MGWQGKVLRVDLTAGTCADEPLNMEWAAKYLGQRGLATKYLMEEIDPKVDPLSPDNKLIFATGPLTGTMASTAGRYSVITKGALTGAIACSNSGGHFGAELKFAGWDMVILEGKAKKPVILSILDDKAELLPAGELWGKSVWETEPAIKARLGDPQVKVASIGRAGENGVMFACIMNDLDRAAGRSGVGTVMGSKNLKALAARGTVGVSVNDPEAFMAAAAAANGQIDADDFATYGTMMLIDVMQEFGSLPTRNNREVQFEGAGRINAITMRTNRLTDGRPNLINNKGCFGCTIACGRVSKMDPGHFAVAGKPGYHGASGGLEYESAYALASMLGVDDIEAATYANYICNEQGMDPMSFGATLGAAMELYETGAITEKETGGLALTFGSAEALVKAVEMTGSGEGFGKELGLGSKRLCEKYGRPEFSMSVKGQEFAGYDGRAMQAMGLAYATCNRGACHNKADPYEVDLERIDTEGKAEVIKTSQDALAIPDSVGVCQFPGWGLDVLATLLDAACEGTWTEDVLAETGERIWNLERQFNLAAGFTGKDDTLPPRLLKEALRSGTAKGKVAGLEVMLPEYYKLRGWDAKGVPTKDTLARLGLG